MLQTVSPALARRIALGAQGFGRRSGVTPGIRQLDALVNRLELLQIDSVNVFERSHYLPAFSRLAGSAGRSRFERVYGLPEQIFPAELLGRRVEPADAHRELVRRAARAHGIGTANDFADYFRLKSAPTLAAIRDLTDAGELLPVEVPGWGPAGSPGAAWLHRDARLPRSVDADAVLSPFDPVVWNRGRAQRLFGFHYRIEIYTPQPKRVFGYYVLPVLLGDTIVGRVDLKNDRQAGVLRVQAAWSEPGAPRDTAERLAGVLRETAAWQGLGAIDVRPRGTLAAALAAEL
ncbi:winged helix-turn-helix domain-containing protein [Cryobacterium sp. TmT2-59]|uniref:winged helix-turn-helix domain-containing protein n=1 Tax=Cryobacterium sp. TmT2-59 TaxID=1259264 RepID=UPI0010696AA1|nr:crosslink repair DNA glycosylase YcaQ family protein [Cryobacterium sp. TmT2-59]TFC80505.1 winged helix-turn-helix domain-containing protein [Cryobacterium sp. TmT2-59]